MHNVDPNGVNTPFQMATEEHKYLADIIKTTHATLREEAQNYGSEIAWKRHVSRKDVLQKYACSMQQLATTYWVENSLNTEYATCRIEWIKSQCEEYFLNGGKQKYDEREESIRIKMDKDLADIEPFVNYNFNIKNETNHLGLDISFQESNREITLLDVGSCYNPFQTLNMFDVTAIDLNGIPDKVLHCDFLSVPIGTRKILSDDKQEILQLAENSYKVVVFSLFLEYLPCSKQRYICCKKAYNLLESSGIFFIVSPDSKHVNANAKFIKSWRYVLSKLGFMRIKYEKLRHIHCIMFRKCVFKHVAVRWANLQMLAKNDPLYQDQNAIYIPQDFRNVSGEIKQREKENYDTNEMIFMFNELPFGET